MAANPSSQATIIESSLPAFCWCISATLEEDFDTTELLLAVLEAPLVITPTVYMNGPLPERAKPEDGDTNNTHRAQPAALQNDEKNHKAKRLIEGAHSGMHNQWRQSNKGTDIHEEEPRPQAGIHQQIIDIFAVTDSLVSHTQAAWPSSACSRTYSDSAMCPA
jgi:hypothetical protein